MFKLGNFAVKEVIYGVAQNFSDEILYTLDQLQSAEVSIESESQDITDKNGNIIRTIYKSKTGNFTSTSALLSPAILNAGSGSDAMEASDVAPIQMPKIVLVPAGGTIDISDIKSGEVPHIIGIYANGANGKALTPADYTITGSVLKVPAAAADAPIQYLVKYERDAETGIALINRATDYPDTIKLTLYVAVVDPCSDTYKAAYLYLPSFQPDPAMTLSLSSDSQTVDYKGKIQTSFCSCNKEMYILYFPGEDAILTGTCEATETASV